MVKQKENFFAAVYQMVSRIPSGRVATYGQIAAFCGNPAAARSVGWALHVCNVNEISWFRVINRRGEISTACREHPAARQAALLKREGVEVKYKQGIWTVDLRKYQWYN
jgi:methylated-DNA-protein-cysteine methyltransferase-like protein